MKKILSICLVLMSVSAVVMAEHVIDSGKNPQFLYVLSAKSGSFEDGKLTLKDVPLVIYFSDRPERIAGHMSLEKFAENWGEEKESLKADPPNATLSIFNEQGNQDVVLEISQLRLQGETLAFKVKLLDESKGIPKSFGHATLFIDRINSTDPFIQF